MRNQWNRVAALLFVAACSCGGGQSKASTTEDTATATADGAGAEPAAPAATEPAPASADGATAEPVSADAEAKPQPATAQIPAPEGSEDGMVSDFEDAKVTARFGHGWDVSSDQLTGGKSKAAMKIAPKGAGGSKGALAVSGTVTGKKGEYAFAGVMFSPGPESMKPANLSSKKELTFSAKGDGKTYSLLLYVENRGLQPIVKTFVAGSKWQDYHFQLEEFDGVDGHDIMGVFFGSTQPGRFGFQLDNVAFH
jgi:hypothetical protein